VDAGEQQTQTIEDNRQSLASLEAIGREVNALQIRNQRAALDAGLPGQFAQASSNVSALLRGEIPTDVSQQVRRASTARSFAGGFQGAGLSSNLTARDLGLTSLGLQQTGFQQFGALAQLINPNPFNVQTMFFSPQQRLQHATNERNARFQRDLMAAGVKAAPSPMQAAIGRGVSAFGQTVGQFGALAAGQAFMKQSVQASNVPTLSKNNVQGGFPNTGQPGSGGLMGMFA